MTNGFQVLMLCCLYALLIVTCIKVRNVERIVETTHHEWTVFTNELAKGFNVKVMNVEVKQ